MQCVTENISPLRFVFKELFSTAVTPYLYFPDDTHLCYLYLKYKVTAWDRSIRIDPKKEPKF